MPAELRPNWKRKVNASEMRQKKIKVVNVEETLKALEQKEISRKRKEIDVSAVKEESKSDNENEVRIFLYSCFVVQKCWKMKICRFF